MGSSKEAAGGKGKKMNFSKLRFNQNSMPSFVIGKVKKMSNSNFVD